MLRREFLAAVWTSTLMKSERGVALVIVLWIVTLLTVIASSFLFAMRTETKIVSNGMARAKAEAAAEAAVHRALFEVYKPFNDTERWHADGVTHVWQYAGAEISVMMQDESGKIDINRANDQLLRGLFLAQGAEADEASALIDVIADWRDPDALKRLKGAEEAEYVAAGRTYKPANAPFQSIEELKLVLGMTASLYQRIEPHITIFSRQPGVNAQIATRETLRAIPGVTEPEIDAYLAQRDAARQAKLPIPYFTQAQAYAAGSSNFATNISARAEMPDGTVFVRDAVAVRTPFPKRPVAFVRWQEGVERPVTAAALAAPPPPKTN